MTGKTGEIVLIGKMMTLIPLDGMLELGKTAGMYGVQSAPLPRWGMNGPEWRWGCTQRRKQTGDLGCPMQTLAHCGCISIFPESFW